MTPPRVNSGEIAIRPDATAWPMLIAGALDRITDEHRRFRTQLGLPHDATIIMSGHQAEFWHPGILAKYFALNAAAEVTGAHPVWLTVDQDSGAPWRVRFPIVETENGGPRLDVRELGTTSAPLQGDIPTGCMAPFEPGLPQTSAAEPFVSEGVRAIERALNAHRSAPTAAAQVAGALDDLVAPLTRVAPALFASLLPKTDAFAMLVDRMERDPRSCTIAYNTAVERFPIAALRKLGFEDERRRYELPLWRIEFGKPRRHVFSDELASIPRDQLAPKALLMTGLVRWLGCELFIHGLGGGKYELVTDDWFARWLPEAHPAPAVVASATLTLPLTIEVPAEREIARAAWASHRALHDPGMVGDTDAAEAKMALVRSIAAARGAGADARIKYVGMHAVLGKYRNRHANEIELARDKAARLAARRVEARIAADRTWAFPLYPRDQLAALGDRAHRAFAR